MRVKLQRVGKWIFKNLFLPIIPVIVRILVRMFSRDDVTLWCLDDLLYYNFFICLLLHEKITDRRDVVSGIMRFTLACICGLDLILIALSLTGSANEFALTFSMATAVICACMGIIYEMVDAFSERGENEYE